MTSDVDLLFLTSKIMTDIARAYHSYYTNMLVSGGEVLKPSNVAFTIHVLEVSYIGRKACNSIES
jgi:hypothetical protein